MVANLSRFGANAVVPDQLLHYVAAVSGLESRACGLSVLHHGGDQAVLVGYPLADSLNEDSYEEAVQIALSTKGLKRLTVLGPGRPRCAPADAQTTYDTYWQIPLPAQKPTGKLANMLRRGQRDLEITKSCDSSDFTDAHATLVQEFCRLRKDILDPGSVYLFGQLSAYLGTGEEVVLFSAWNREDRSLAGFAIGDFSALATAFYMFAFRAADAPPGTADLLLEAIVQEGGSRGHSRLNLGLGINGGIEFFKKKWGASPFLPFAETSWNVVTATPRKSWLGRLFGK